MFTHVVMPCLLGFVCIQIIIINLNIIIVLLTTETGQAGRLTDDPEGFKEWGEGCVPKKASLLHCFHFFSIFFYPRALPEVGVC